MARFEMTCSIGLVDGPSNPLVGADLVDIHVGLRSASRLEDHKGKVVHELAIDDLSGSG